ncbi:hypothetical protein [Telluribacter sp.]|jgi:hypothetical protein|uniref:hypothetical protein n=1 Tax=Telluribacter sp. TaxID=1978767 RepID=UPI002E0EC569|nr:hypothetical protein [Telluribacter sp.]
MKIPHQLQPGDCFFFRASIGEEIKQWKVVAIGLNSLIATCEHAYQNVPFFYEQLTNPEGHFCYVQPRAGWLTSLFSALTSKSAESTEQKIDWRGLSANPSHGLAA